MCLCCYHALAHFVSAAMALLLLMACQQTCSDSSLLRSIAYTAKHDPVSCLGCSPSTWRPSGTCLVSLCARTTTTAWAQRRGGLQNLQHSTHAGTMCLVGCAAPHRHPCGACRVGAAGAHVSRCVSYSCLRQSAVASSMHHWHGGSWLSLLAMRCCTASCSVPLPSQPAHPSRLAERGVSVQGCGLMAWMPSQ